MGGITVKSKMLCCLLGVGALAFGLGVLLSCFMPSEVLVVIMAILIAGGAAALAQENEARRNESAKERAERRSAEAAARAEMIRELKNK